ncbi:MAG: vanadium-dependent haloperoxidase [Opitutales bacterium]
MNSKDRINEAYDVRVDATKLAQQRNHPEHKNNTDESRFNKTHLMSFTKGLKHDKDTGLVSDSAHYQQFVVAIESGDQVDFEKTPIGPNAVIAPAKDADWESARGQGKLPSSSGPANFRAWESQSAGLAFDLQGPDAQAVTMPPAPALGSDELKFEMAEVYTCARLRDTSFKEIDEMQDELEPMGELKALQEAMKFCGLPNQKGISPRPRWSLRGVLRGDEVGPYISQFLFAGNNGLGNAHKPDDGYISYGAVRVDQRVRVAKPKTDFMQTWDEWLDVQNGADFRGQEDYLMCPQYRFIATPRDLATYVHYDALYEAYLNACLWMLGKGVPFDNGLPFGAPDAEDHQQGFALFGPPHILSLVTEVATRALKAVRYQKFNVHRRLRPETLAGRISKAGVLQSIAPELDDMAQCKEFGAILNGIDAMNNGSVGGGNYLLPMAFPEGSPMHPSYGAGHATVAGACVTILKAFFDHTQTLDVTGKGVGKCFTSVLDSQTQGSCLSEVDVTDSEGNASTLTVEGELNKLASNISIGRNWAGVHYFSDYYDSVVMGEEIAIGILEEQMLTYTEKFSMTIPLFDGSEKIIKN